MIYEENDWSLYYEDMPYRGESREGVPHGFGVLVLEFDEDEIPEKYYVGHFVEGVPDGRGYELHRRITRSIRTRPATYEEVMESASFDAAGRPIHYECGPTITEEVVSEDWIIKSDGLWSKGELVEPKKRRKMALKGWTNAILEVRHDEVFGKSVYPGGYTYKLKVAKCSPDGDLSDSGEYLRITPLDEERLMVQDNIELFVLRRGEEHIFDSDPNEDFYNRTIYRLK